jgi:uncharacterized protein
LSLAAFALIATGVMVAGFVQGTAGVGFALIVAPILALLAPDLVPVSLLLLMLPLNAYVAWRERRAIDPSGAIWITVGRFAGTFGGLWLLATLTPSLLGILIGVVTILLALATLVAPSFDPDRRALAAAGVVTGITETATGIGGPPLALVYQHQGAATLRATLAFCFLAGQLMSLAMLAVAGRVGVPQFEAAILLLPALAVGALASRLTHGRVGGRPLRIFVLLFAIASGIVLLARS